jgi:hypothetical protein
VVNTSAGFPFFGFSTRWDDQVGDLLGQWADDELEDLEEIQTSLSADERKMGELVPIRLQASVSEVGALEPTAIALTGAEQRWKLSFNTRGPGAGDDVA